MPNVVTNFIGRNLNPQAQPLGANELNAAFALCSVNNPIANSQQVTQLSGNELVGITYQGVDYKVSFALLQTMLGGGSTGGGGGGGGGGTTTGSYAADDYGNHITDDYGNGLVAP